MSSMHSLCRFRSLPLHKCGWLRNTHLILLQAELQDLNNAAVHAWAMQSLEAVSGLQGSSPQPGAFLESAHLFWI
jgi:hypothetical protein